MRRNSFGLLEMHVDNRLRAIVSRTPIVTEAEFKDAINGYNLKEGLFLLAALSRNIFHQEVKAPYTRIGISIIRHSAGIFLTQFAIEYLVNIFLISGANDFKKGSFNEKDNFLCLFDIYSNSLIIPKSEKRDTAEILVPISFEQFRSQRPAKDIFARQLAIFEIAIREMASVTLGDIGEVFLESTGLTMLEAISLSFGVFSVIVANILFKKETFTQAAIASWKDLLTEKKVNAFLNLYSCTYAQFREEDIMLNRNLKPDNTRTRFNPLWKRPILRMSDDTFLVPSVTAYSTASFYGLFWWFDDYYSGKSKKMGQNFRIFFGSVFEKYVGIILRDLYGESNVSGQITYGPKKAQIDFTDWTVLHKNKMYLFEAKAYQFALETLQTGNPDNIQKEVVNKFVGAIIQVFKRVQDISKYPELSHLRGREVIPIIVVYDIPFISQSIYDVRIRKALSDLDNSLSGIKDFKFYFMAVESLEEFYYCVDEVDIEVLLEIVKSDSTTSFDVEVKKRIQDRSRQNYLDRVFEEYMDKLVKE
jgi:hypothetical protein